MNSDSCKRCALVCFAFIALFSGFVARLIYLQVIKHDEYAALAAEKHVYKHVIYAERGTILDANNDVLAHNVPVENVVSDATHVNDRDAVVALVSAGLGLSSKQLAEKLNSERRYIVIKREVPESVAGALREKLRARNLRGIYFEHDATRMYPNGSMLCHVIGFTDFEHHGIQGVVKVPASTTRANTCMARTAIAISSAIPPGRRSSSIGDRSARPVTATRSILLSILTCKTSSKMKSTPPWLNTVPKKRRLF